VSRYQKGKTNLDFTEARDSEWQWHQLGHMEVCISLQTDNHASTQHSVFTGRMPFLPPNQQRQSTEGSQTYHNSYLTGDVDHRLSPMFAQICRFYYVLQLAGLLLNFRRQADTSLSDILFAQPS